MIVAPITAVFMFAAPDAGTASGAARLESRCIPVAGDVTLRPMSSKAGQAVVGCAECRGAWTGNEMIVWSADPTGELSSDARGKPGRFLIYSPAGDSWRQLKLAGIPVLYRPSLVWVAGRAILWGGADVGASEMTDRGLIVDPAKRTARPTATREAPTPRQYHVALGVGSRMLVLGGIGRGGPHRGWFCDGAFLDPLRNAWSPMAPLPAEACESIPGMRLAAATPDRVGLILIDATPARITRAALYDVARASWTLGPVWPSETPPQFENQPAFGADGALYAVSQASTLIRVDPRDGRMEEIGQVCAPGNVVRVGNRLRVIGDVSCDIDLAARSCALPTRALGGPSFQVLQLLVPTGEGFIAWGYQRGIVARFGEKTLAEATLPRSAGAGVRGAVIVQTPGSCGGAIPPPWAPVPRISVTKGAGLPLLIRRGNRNVDPEVVAEVKTDEDGLFGAALPPGTYCAIEPAQRSVKLDLPGNTDPESAKCLAVENAKCAAVFEVPAGSQAPVPVVITLKRTCFGPCYRGPPPP